MPYLLVPALEGAGNVKLHAGNCLHLRSEALHGLFSSPRHIRATPAIPKSRVMTGVGNQLQCGAYFPLKVLEGRDKGLPTSGPLTCLLL